MDIPFISSASQTGDQYDKSKGPLSLRVGETVRAVVARNSADGSVLLRLKNSLVEAKTDLAFAAGQVLLLKVSSSGDEIQLRVASGQAAADAVLTNALFTTLAGLKNLGSAAGDITRLVDFLNALPQSLKLQLPELGTLEKLLLPVETLDGKAVEKAVLDSGVLLETKLRLIAEKGALSGGALGAEIMSAADNDLKGLLLKMKQVLADPAVAAAFGESGSGRQLERALERLIGAIEYQQVQSKLGESLQLFLPVLWEELREEWIKFKKTERGLDEPSYSCTINLDFEQRGRLRSQLLLQAGRVHINMLSDNDAFAGMLREHADLLRKQFEDAGLPLGGVTVTVRHDLDLSKDAAERLDMRI